MNILILSCGTRNKIIQYFKASLGQKGKVIAADCNRLAPALYEADAFYIVPRITDKHYLERILDICKSEKVAGILSLIDSELSLLAGYKKKFMESGVLVIGSDSGPCNRALDKWDMYCWLKGHKYKCAKTFHNKEDFYHELQEGLISFPVFVKPVKGSASIDIRKVFEKETVELLFKHADNLIIQEYISGQEIGADCYIDMVSKELISVFTKKKIKMRSGETDKAVSFRDERLFGLIKRFVKEAGFLGQIDIDLFEVNEEYYISEVNPRFGGGYPHAYECGVDHMKLIMENLNGKANQITVGAYKNGVYMMKYNELKIIEDD